MAQLHTITGKSIRFTGRVSTGDKLRYKGVEPLIMSTGVVRPGHIVTAASVSYVDLHADAEEFVELVGSAVKDKPFTRGYLVDLFEKV